MSDTTNNEKFFALNRIYIKDVSLEMPLGFMLFQKMKQGAKPSFQQDMGTRLNKIADDLFEVVLTVTVTAKLDEQTAFLAEVHQAGLFQMRGFSDAVLRKLGGTNCPTILFPYARQMIDMLLVQASLPPMMLPPVNFDMLYEEALKQEAAGQQQTH